VTKHTCCTSVPTGVVSGGCAEAISRSVISSNGKLTLPHARTLPACRLVRRVDRTDANLRTHTFGVRLLFQAKRNINAGEELLC
jgi:hypothetical protein